MLRLRVSDEKADVWSVGAVAYLLLCGSFPYQPSYQEWTGKKMQEVIRDGGHPRCERSWLSESAASMLKTMLMRKPSKRPTAKEALYLPFIVDATIDSKTPDENLPCLRPVWEAALSLGTSQSNLDKTNVLDQYLNSKQVENHGRKIPLSEPCDTPEPPRRSGDWIKAQNIALNRAMACNVAEANGKIMSTTSSDDEKLPSSLGACGSTCSTAVEQNQKVSSVSMGMFDMKVEC
jgi:serine/threonine protein kinase